MACLCFAAGDSNLYRYVSNNPTGATDPSGMNKYFVQDGRVMYVDENKLTSAWDSKPVDIAEYAVLEGVRYARRGNHIVAWSALEAAARNNTGTSNDWDSFFKRNALSAPLIRNQLNVLDVTSERLLEEIQRYEGATLIDKFRKSELSLEILARGGGNFGSYHSNNEGIEVSGFSGFKGYKSLRTLSDAVSLMRTEIRALDAAGTLDRRIALRAESSIGSLGETWEGKRLLNAYGESLDLTSDLLNDTALNIGLSIIPFDQVIALAGALPNFGSRMTAQEVRSAERALASQYFEQAASSPIRVSSRAKNIASFGDQRLYYDGVRQSRAQAVLEEAAKASKVKLADYVDDVVFTSGKSPWFSMVDGRRTIALSELTLRKSEAGQLITAVHELSHARHSAKLGYENYSILYSQQRARIEILVEVRAMKTVERYLGGLSAQQIADSMKYINSWNK